MTGSALSSGDLLARLEAAVRDLETNLTAASNVCCRLYGWFAWLGLALMITVVAAITGIKPKGTRHGAHTRLMGGARSRVHGPSHLVAAAMPATFFEAFD